MEDLYKYDDLTTPLILNAIKRKSAERRCLLSEKHKFAVKHSGAAGDEHGNYTRDISFRVFSVELPIIYVFLRTELLTLESTYRQ